MNAKADVNRDQVDTLARHCLDHLHQEIEMMIHLNEAQRDVRMALVSGNTERLSDALAVQDLSSEALAPVRLRRQELRKAIAARMQWPLDQSTVHALSRETSGTLRADLLTARDKLRDLVEQSQQLMRGNAMLTKNWSELIENVFARLTGTAHHSDRYGADGQQEGPQLSSIFQTRC